jgi:hypothetical protein
MACLGARESVSLAFGQYAILINMVTSVSKIILTVIRLPKDTPSNIQIGL